MTQVVRVWGLVISTRSTTSKLRPCADDTIADLPADILERLRGQHRHGKVDAKASLQDMQPAQQSRSAGHVLHMAIHQVDAASSSTSAASDSLRYHHFLRD